MIVSPWVALVVLDAVTVATFARCFDGPGELGILLPVCVGAHLLTHFGRRLRRGGRAGTAVVLWVLTVVLVAYAPVALVDGASFRFGFLPLTHTWHVLSGQLSDAWGIFSNRVAPVVQAPGLVLAAAWASGVLALAAEALDADSSLPAIVALVPAFDIVVFTGTLGTATGRAPELAALAGLAVWYLAGVSRQHAGEQVVTARLEGTTSPRKQPVLKQVSGLLSGRRTPTAVAGLALVAAFSAGVIGPLFPGATSTAWLAWHGTGKASSLNKTNRTGPGVGPVTISNFVQVGEEEIDNSATPLFRIYSARVTREILFVDDEFNGSTWTEEPVTQRSTIASLSGSVPTYEAHPPAPIEELDSEHLIQVFQNIDLGGPEVPVPGIPLAIDSNIQATIGKPDGPVDLGTGALTDNASFAVEADVSPSPEVAQANYNPMAPAAPPIDLKVPAGVPPAVRTLATTIVAGATTIEAKADDIQDYLLRHYSYFLPSTVPAPQPTGWAALESFLFQTKKGYCQQFASAFGALARIDGLPTRVVVGFLPTAPKGDSWVVTGLETHAWPQVYFPGTGWVDFEPTPGASKPTYAHTETTSAPPPTRPIVGASSTIAHNLHPLPSGPVTGLTVPTSPYPTVPGRSGGTGGSGDVSLVLLALLALAVAWAVAVPTWRFVRLRRARDPARGALMAWNAAIGVLAAAGLHRRRAETYLEFARRVRQAGAIAGEAEAALGRLADTANRALFAKVPPTTADSRRAAADSAMVRRSARHSLTWGTRFLLVMDPRDLLATT